MQQNAAYQYPAHRLRHPAARTHCASVPTRARASYLSPSCPPTLYVIVSLAGVCGDPFQESTSNVASYQFNSNTPCESPVLTLADGARTL